MGRLRANVENHVIVGHVFHFLGDRFCRLGKFLGSDHVHRDRDMHLVSNIFGRRNQVRFIQGLAHRMPGSRQKGIGNTATHHQLIDLVGQGLQHFQLGGHLGTTDDGHQGFFRILQSLAQCIQFIGQQRARAGHRSEFTHPVGRRLGTVRRAKRIHHIDITQCRHFL